MKRFLVLLLVVPLLASCGPIYGQLMRLQEGIKEFQIVSGPLETLRPRASIVIAAPFTKRPEAYFICRNDDPISFADHLQARGYKTSLTFEEDPAQVAAADAKLRSRSALELQQELHLDAPPDLILFGTLLKRETTVAPLRGVVMEQAFRLEFFDLATRTSTVVEIAARTLAQDSIATMVEELVRRSRP